MSNLTLYYLTYDHKGHAMLCNTPPFCPMCHYDSLRRNVMPDVGETHWYCTHCHTQWDVHSLIEALIREER